MLNEKKWEERGVTGARIARASQVEFARDGLEEPGRFLGIEDGIEEGWRVFCGVRGAVRLKHRLCMLYSSGRVV